MKKHLYIGMFILVVGLAASEIVYEEEGIEDANVQDNMGVTMLHTACMAKNLDQVKLLVSCLKVEVNVSDISGYTPLHYACIKGCLPIVKYLIEECNADIEAKTNEGKTGLILAATSDKLDVIEYLLKKHFKLIGIVWSYIIVSEVRMYFSSFIELDSLKKLLPIIEKQMAKYPDFQFKVEYLGFHVKDYDIALFLLQQGVNCKINSIKFNNMARGILHANELPHKNPLEIMRILQSKVMDLIYASNFSEIKKIKQYLIDCDISPKLFPLLFTPFQMHKIVMEKYLRYIKSKEIGLRELLEIVKEEYSMAEFVDENNNTLLHLIGDAHVYNFIVCESPGLLLMRNDRECLPFSPYMYRFLLNEKADSSSPSSQ